MLHIEIGVVVVKGGSCTLPALKEGLGCTQGRAQPHFLNLSHLVNYKQLRVGSQQYPSNRVSKYRLAGGRAIRSFEHFSAVIPFLFLQVFWILQDLDFTLTNQHSKRLDARPRLGPVFFIFMQFSGNFCPNNRLAGILGLPPLKPSFTGV